jgi:Fis family transcriptional regulator
MPKHIADQIPALFELSALQATSVGHLVGQALGTIERELVLQTLRRHQGNRTRAANVLKISVRSLRDKIRIYRQQGQSVPEPGLPCSDGPSEPPTWLSH